MKACDHFIGVSFQGITMTCTRRIPDDADGCYQHSPTRKSARAKLRAEVLELCKRCDECDCEGYPCSKCIREVGERWRDIAELLK